MELLIVSGLSGAGKSVAMNALEDIGFFCIDNVPAGLLPSITAFSKAGDNQLERVALSMDVRGCRSREQIETALQQLDEQKTPYKILFLDAPDDVLMRRYSETRRRHPISIAEGISTRDAFLKERQILQPLKDRADYTINTGLLSTSQNKERICDLFLKNGGAKNAMRLTIMSSIAQDEVRKLSERTRFGFKRAQENSVLLGQNNLFGYNKVDGRLEIVEHEAAIVREVFERYTAGDLGLRAIANDLERRGIRGRQGRPLTYSTLYGMIRNPKYKGCYAGRRYASRDYRDKRSYRLSEDKWLVHEDDRVPAIVPEAMWDEANRLLAARGQTMKQHAQASQNRYAYSGKLICAKHGTAFHRHVYKSKSRGEVECWNCKLYREKGKQGGCDSPTVYSHELDRILARVFEQVTDERSTAMQEYIDNLRAFAAQQDNAPALAQVEQELETVTRRKDKLLDLALAGALSNEEFRQRNEACNEQLAALEQQRKELQNADKTLEQRIRRVESLRRTIEERWQTNCGFSREMSKALVDRIVVDADESRTCIRLEIFLTTGSDFCAEPVLSAATQSPDAQMKLTFPRSRSGHQGEYSVTYLVRWHLG